VVAVVLRLDRLLVSARVPGDVVNGGRWQDQWRWEDTVGLVVIVLGILFGTWTYF